MRQSRAGPLSSLVPPVLATLNVETPLQTDALMRRRVLADAARPVLGPKAPPVLHVVLGPVLAAVGVRAPIGRRAPVGSRVNLTPGGRVPTVPTGLRVWLSGAVFLSRDTHGVSARPHCRCPDCERPCRRSREAALIDGQLAA